MVIHCTRRTESWWCTCIRQLHRWSAVVCITLLLYVCLGISVLVHKCPVQFTSKKWCMSLHSFRQHECSNRSVRHTQTLYTCGYKWQVEHEYTDIKFFFSIFSPCHPRVQKQPLSWQPHCVLIPDPCEPHKLWIKSENKWLFYVLWARSAPDRFGFRIFLGLSCLTIIVLLCSESMAIDHNIKLPTHFQQQWTTHWWAGGHLDNGVWGAVRN